MLPTQPRIFAPSTSQSPPHKESSQPMHSNQSLQSSFSTTPRRLFTPRRALILFFFCAVIHIGFQCITLLQNDALIKSRLDDSTTKSATNAIKVASPSLQKAKKDLQNEEKGTIRPLAEPIENPTAAVAKDVDVVVPDIAHQNLPQKYVTFELCGHLGGSYISVMMGLTIARILERTVVLPMEPFSKYFDVEHFLEHLPNTPILKKLPPFIPAKPHLHSLHQKMLKPEQVKSIIPSLLPHHYVSLGCPLFSVDFDSADSKDIQFAWDVFDALQATPEIYQDAQVVLESIRNFAPDESAVVMHLRFDDEWVEHCNNWSGDNCYESMANVKKYLAKHNIAHSHCYLIDYSPYITGRLNDQPQKMNFVTKELLIPKDLTRYKGDKDLLLQLEFVIAKSSDTFVGNSVDILDALVLLSRERRGLPQYHYNGGGIPLQKFLPLAKLEAEKSAIKIPWVFNYWNSSSNYDNKVRAAVLSAKLSPSLRPICAFYGQANDMSRWLQEQGVQVAFRENTWTSKLQQLRLTYDPLDESKPEFKSVEHLAASLARFDSPLLKEVDNEPYLLYTDIDVLFLRSFRMSDVAVWPSYVACGPLSARDAWLPCDAGVLIMNVAAMRSAHAQIVQFAIESGSVDFVGGAGAQGLLAASLKGRLDALPPSFVWKPYWGAPSSLSAKRDSQPQPQAQPQAAATDSDALILHIDRPPLEEYHAFLKDGSVQYPIHRSPLTRCRETLGCALTIEHYSRVVQEAQDARG